MQWLMGSAALLATTVGPLEAMLGRPRSALMWGVVAAAGWIGVWRMLPRRAAGAR